MPAHRHRPTLHSAQAQRIEVHYYPIGDIKPNTRNPRHHTPKHVRQLADSIAAFGNIVPLLIDKDFKLICGHGRLLACQALGLSEVPAIRVEHLDEAQKRAFMIADNKLTELSTWDDRLLGEEFKILLDLNFDVELTGFEPGEIDLRIENLSNSSEPSEDLEASFANADGPAVSRPGDLWILGRHRLLCGNALDGDCYELLMKGEQASMVFADPPYNVPIKGHVSGLGAIHHREFDMACGEMNREEFTAFLRGAFALATQFTKPGSIHFQCMDWRHLPELLSAGEAVYSELKNLCVWVKHNAGMGSFYRSQHELVAVFKHGRAPHQNNIALGAHGRHRTNVWNYPGVTSPSHGSGEGNLLALHPTVKPAALVADAILDCTRRNEIVLDNFVGSGSSIIAAERVGRRCFGLELDPYYVDVAVRRYQAYTGESAVHLLSGKTFDHSASAMETAHV